MATVEIHPRAVPVVSSGSSLVTAAGSSQRPSPRGTALGGRLCSWAPCVARKSGAAAPALGMGLCGGPLSALGADGSRGLGRWGPLSAPLFFFFSGGGTAAAPPEDSRGKNAAARGERRRP